MKTPSKIWKEAVPSEFIILSRKTDVPGFITFLGFFLVPSAPEGGGGGGIECNLTGRCPYFKNFHNPFRQKFAF